MRLGSATTAEGGRIELRRLQSCFALYVDDQILMSTEGHGSEIAMAAFGLPEADSRKRVLVGGLGLGYTLRAVLDAISGDSDVDCVELLAPLERWHREGPLGAIAGRPLDDPRVTLHIDDVTEFIAHCHDGTFDAILLDIDNGPFALTATTNHDLYQPEGLARLFELLRPSGHVVVWSAEGDSAFCQRMHDAGFSVSTEHVSAWADDEEPKCDAMHALFVGRRPDLGEIRL